MKRIFQLIFALLLTLGAILMALGSCTPQAVVPGDNAPEAQAPVPTEAPAPAETPIPAPAEQELPAEEAAEQETPAGETAVETAQTAEPTEAPAPAPAAQASPMEDMTPAERAAAWGLPAPPEGIDLSTTEFKLANSYNNITDQRPNHSFGAGVTVDAVASDAYNHLVEAAQAAGYPILAFRGYIDWWTVLENYYEPAVYSYGAEEAAKTTYVPGCNDHQTALGVDFRLPGHDGGEGADFRGTEAYDWLLANCADYGIILRYPEGQESWYGTKCMNPCHFRYVGVEPARYIMENGITLEQFMLLYDWHAIYVPGVN